jgi:hypothetical protein
MASNVQLSWSRPRDRKVLEKVKVLAGYKGLDLTNMTRTLLFEKANELIAELGLNRINAQSAEPAE